MVRLNNATRQLRHRCHRRIEKRLDDIGFFDSALRRRLRLRRRDISHMSVYATGARERSRARIYSFAFFVVPFVSPLDLICVCIDVIWH